jgi:iron complex transport system substrate-binding protein
MFPPERIVCLTEETVETLYLLGEDRRIVGIDVFAERAANKSAGERITAPEEVIAAAPDIIIGSWCGKKFVPAKVACRPGFCEIPAVRSGFLREIKSTLILQPGPAALTDGLDALVGIVDEWRAGTDSARP